MRPTTLATAAAAILALAFAAPAQTIHVPADVPNIQTAVNVAPTGATILVAPGTYTENINVPPKALTIRGPAGPAATILQSAGARAMAIGPGAVITLEGFTIRPPAPNVPSGIVSGAALTVRDCLFTDCRPPAGNGGAAQINGGAASFVRCRFTANVGGSFGGGISVINNASITVHSCQFQQNSSTVAGGAIDLQPGVASIANSLFVQNTSANGGALATIVPGSRADNSTFAGNTVTTGVGQAIAFGGAPVPDAVAVANSIFWGNLGGATGPIAATSPSTTFDVTYSDVQGGFPGAGNINADPMFVSVGLPGDYRLQPGSPCLDAGTNLTIPVDTLDVDGDGNVSEPLPLDLAGSPRRTDEPTVPDTGQGSAPIVDIGSFESIGVPPCRADFDDNGVVNSSDISAFLTEWLQAITNGCR